MRRTHRDLKLIQEEEQRLIDRLLIKITNPQAEERIEYIMDIPHDMPKWTESGLDWDWTVSECDAKWRINKQIKQEL